MKRHFIVLLWGLAVWNSGCASSARYVQKNDLEGTGIVAIPANTNEWPTYHRREALAKIQEHVGPHYEIISEMEVVTGQTTISDAQVNTESLNQRRFPRGLSEFQTVRGSSTTRDITEWHIHYRRKPLPAASFNSVGSLGGNPTAPTSGPTPSGPSQPASGVMPAGGIPRTAAPPPGVVPNVLPSGGPTSSFTPRHPPIPEKANCST
ncbi:MAG: hypothetical protein RMJ56_09670 [Gemmataceae bacterium]|nr:hypothetical protein [Gemmata sp.]MDW8197857.1 hypothetical protein [Gemmataceae bacterium]